MSKPRARAQALQGLGCDRARQRGRGSPITRTAVLLGPAHYGEHIMPQTAENGAAVIDSQSILLTAKQIAQRLGCSVSCWYRLVNRKMAPCPNVVKPWSWLETTVEEWKKTIPTVEEAKKKLQAAAEQKGRFGTWELVEALVKNREVSWDGFFNWKRNGLLSKDDIASVTVWRKRKEGPRLIEMTFVRTFAINLLNGSSGDRRSKSRKRYLSTKEKYRHGKETYVTMRAATRDPDRPARKWIDNATLRRWSDPDGDGCVHLGGQKLSTVYCDMNDGSIVLSDDPNAVRCWYLSELNRVRKKIKDTPSNVDSYEDVYSLDKTSELTGVPVSTLANKRKVTDALGLVCVEVPVMSPCVRKLNRSGPLKCGKVAFTKESIDAYITTHLNLQNKKGSPGSMTTAESNEKLGITASWKWCLTGKLKHNGLEEYWVDGLGIRKGYRPTIESVDEAKKILDSVGGNARKAANVFRKLMAEGKSRQTNQMGTTETEKSIGAPAKKKKAVRSPSKRVQKYYKICDTYRQKHLDDPENYGMAKAVHDAMPHLPKNYLGITLEEQKNNLRRYAKRYNKPNKNGGGQTS